jgi:cell division protein FtsL
MSGRAASALLLVAVAAISAVAVVDARQQNRRVFVELTRLEAERDELNIEFGRLKLEQATWAEANRIEQVAHGALGMTFPGAAETVVIRP